MTDEQIEEIRMRLDAVGDGYSTHWWMYRGHVDLAAFRLAVTRETGCDLTEAPEARHEYWRLVPTAPGSEFDLRYLPAQQPGRGAFPVTCCDWT